LNLIGIKAVAITIARREQCFAFDEPGREVVLFLPRPVHQVLFFVQAVSMPSLVLTQTAPPVRILLAPPPAPAADSTSKPGDASSTPAADTSASPDDKDKNPEAYWRKRFQKAHDDLSKAEKELDVLQRELNKNQVQYYSDPQTALMQQNNRTDINEGATKIAAKQKEVDSLKQQIADMEDELRKSGGNPGWAR